MKKIIVAVVLFGAILSGGFYYMIHSINAFEFKEPTGILPVEASWTACVVADSHYLSPTLHDNGEAFDRFLHYSDKLVHLSEDILDALTWEVTRDQPDFLFLAGDMTCNGEKTSHLEVAQRLGDIEKNGTAVYVVPGNHDIQNPMARQYFGMTIWETETVTKSDFAEIYDDFGFAEAISRDKRSLSYLIAPTEDTWFLMLDSAIYSYNIENNVSEQDGELYESTLNWIRQCSRLAEEREARLIAVMHHSLLHHSDQINQGYTIRKSDEAQKLFVDCGIELVLTGHIHLQNIESINQEEGSLTDIATGSLMVYPNQYGQLKYDSEKGLEYRTRRLDASGYADHLGDKNSPLNRLDEIAKEFFVEQCCKRQNKALDGIQGLSPEELDLVRFTVSSMNLQYFAGFRNENLAEYTQSEGYKLLMDLPPFFVQDYVSNMIEDDRSNHNVCFLPAH